MNLIIFVSVFIYNVYTEANIFIPFSKWYLKCLRILTKCFFYLFPFLLKMFSLKWICLTSKLLIRSKIINLILKLSICIKICIKIFQYLFRISIFKGYIFFYGDAASQLQWQLERMDAFFTAWLFGIVRCLLETFSALLFYMVLIRKLCKLRFLIGCACAFTQQWLYMEGGVLCIASDCLRYGSTDKRTCSVCDVAFGQHHSAPHRIRYATKWHVWGFIHSCICTYKLYDVSVRVCTQNSNHKISQPKMAFSRILAFWSH